LRAANKAITNGPDATIKAMTMRCAITSKFILVQPLYFQFSLIKSKYLSCTLRYMFIEWYSFKPTQKDFPCIITSWIVYMDMLFTMCVSGGDDKPHINLALEYGYSIPSTKIWWLLKVWLEYTKDLGVLKP
jgi:hypothetical protein